MVEVPTGVQFQAEAARSRDEFARLDARFDDMAKATKITCDGLRFVRGGQPIRLAGVNAEHAVGCGLPGSQPSAAQVEAFFSQLGPEPKLVRTWVFPGMASATDPADPRWAAYDRLVAAAAKHGHYLLVTLLNGQPNCTSFPVTDFSLPLPEKVRGWVKAVTGRHAGDDAVMGFECANEANEADPGVAAWYGAVADLARTHHPGVLVGSGGGHNANNAEAIARTWAHLDFGTHHDYYPLNPLTGTVGPRVAIFNRAAEIAGVPWGVGERGFSVPAGGGGSADQEANARYLVQELNLYLGGDPKASHCGFFCYWDLRWVQRESTTCYPLERTGMYRALCDYRLPTAA